MRINEAGLALIKRFESLRLDAYICPAGKLTIGWGHTGDVKLEDRITEHQAEAVLSVDLDRFERAVSAAAPTANENQFAALVSFTFNEGPEALRTMLAHNPKNLAATEAEFKKWNKAHVGGVLTVLPGLITRRIAERELFLKTVPS